MVKVLFVTMGPYADRFMQLEDDVAAAALADKWAVDTAAEGYDPFNIETAEETPDSLTGWLDSLDGIEAPPAEEGGETEPEQPPVEPPPTEETEPLPSPPPPPPPPDEEATP